MKNKKHISYPLLTVLIILLVINAIRIIGAIIISTKLNQNLFDAATDASTKFKKTQNSVNTVEDEESEEFSVGNKTYSSIEDYLSGE